MIPLDLPPKLWLPHKPAIIRTLPLSRRLPLLPASLLPGMFPAAAALQRQAAAPAIAMSFLQANSTATDLTTFTFAGENLGAAAANRYIVVAFAGAGWASVRTVSSVTIGGVSASLLHFANNSNDHVGLYIAAVPTGTTGDVVITFSGSGNRLAIWLWRLTGVGSTTPHDTADVFQIDDGTTTIDCPAGGAIFGVSAADSTQTLSWTGITETTAGNIPLESRNHSAAAQAFAAGQTGLTVGASTSGTASAYNTIFASLSP